ncbi:Uncharacterised protein [Staphylococcus aureus]|nr:Uncharacterised protein [Staphylococcus aureus]
MPNDPPNSNDTSSMEAAIPEFLSSAFDIIALDASVIAPPKPRPMMIKVTICMAKRACKTQ